jgi:hypothetical protein
MLKAARDAAKKEKEESSSSFPAKNKEGGPANKAKLRRKPWQPSYAHPWPDALPDLGPRSIGPYDPCVDCGCGSWVRYGGAVVCCPCAAARSAE